MIYGILPDQSIRSDTSVQYLSSTSLNTNATEAPFVWTKLQVQETLKYSSIRSVYLYSTWNEILYLNHLFIHLSFLLGKQFRMAIPELLANDIIINCSWYKFDAFHLFTVSWWDWSNFCLLADDGGSFSINWLNVVVIDVEFYKQNFILVLGKGALVSCHVEMCDSTTKFYKSYS